MTIRAEGKVGWVTGGGAGIGAAICKELAACGAKVLCTDRNLASAEHIAADIVDAGGTAVAMQVDVSKEEGNQEAVNRALEEWGSLDMVAINAAIDAASGKSILNCSSEEFRKTASVNYEGSFLGIKAAANAMKDNGIKGSIVVVGSGASVKATPGTFAYSSSKHGLIGIAKIASVDLLPYGIRVNTMLPGMIDTEGLRNTLKKFNMDVPVYADKPELIAEEIVNLLANESPLITGQVIGLERGLSNTQYISAVTEHGERYT